MRAEQVACLSTKVFKTRLILMQCKPVVAPFLNTFYCGHKFRIAPRKNFSMGWTSLKGFLFQLISSKTQKNLSRRNLNTWSWFYGHNSWINFLSFKTKLSLNFLPWIYTMIREHMPVGHIHTHIHTSAIICILRNCPVYSL